MVRLFLLFALAVPFSTGIYIVVGWRYFDYVDNYNGSSSKHSEHVF